jgi:hypothetical protein
MPGKVKKKCKSYNNNDCYNLEKVQESAKKVKAKDVFEGYKDNKRINMKNKKTDKKNKNKKY